MLAHEEIAKGWNVDVGDIAKRGLFLIGSADEIRGQLDRQLIETGTSYSAISESNPNAWEEFAHSMIRPLLCAGGESISSEIDLSPEGV